jgi:hypothetical protein
VFSGGDRRPTSEQKHYHYELDSGNVLANEKLHFSDIDLHNMACEDEENGESSPK